MKIAYILSVLVVLLLTTGCKKDQKLPVKATYVLKGDAAKYYVNGIQESAGAHLILVSGVTTYNWSLNHDTLFKDLWAGDNLSISATSYTSVFYKPGTQSGYYLVDSSNATQTSVTVQ